MARLTGDRIRRMQAAGERPPPLPRRNSNSNSNSNNSLVERELALLRGAIQRRYGVPAARLTNGNNLPQMGSPVVANSPSKTLKKTKRDLISTVKKYVKQKRNLIAMNGGPGGSGHRYWNEKTGRWRLVDKTNVKGYYKQNFTNAGAAKHIKKDRRVYLDVDLRNGKVQHVYDRDGIAKLLANSGMTAKSPLTRRNFTLSNVQPF